MFSSLWTTMLVYLAWIAGLVGIMGWLLHLLSVDKAKEVVIQNRTRDHLER